MGMPQIFRELLSFMADLARLCVSHASVLFLLQMQGTTGGATDQCISAIIPGGDDNSVILGDNFMRSWYTVYTYDIKTRTAYVGLAAAAAMTS